jgi:multidrug efflux pump subunit AcrA (membrane-fusion protein)
MANDGPPDLTARLAAQALTPDDSSPGHEPPSRNALTDTGRTTDGQPPPQAQGANPHQGQQQPQQQQQQPRAGNDAGHGPSRRSLVIVGIVAAVLLVLFILIGVLPDRAKKRQLAERSHQAAEADSVPLVGIQRVTRAGTNSDLMLPGTLQSNHETPVYARASGYISHWYADIGQRVHAGQLLATIDAPDLDQQLSQARQQSANANATLQLNRVNLDRWKILYRDSTVTKQELDTFQSNYDASVANVAAADDNVRRLESLVAYERVTAPFDGVVTARNVEDGVFITTAGTTTTTQAAGAGGNTLIGSAPTTELFRVARTDTVRIYLGVPQAYAPAVHTGLPSTLGIQELAGRTYPGRVVRTASSVDAASRTLLTEVDALNTDGSLLPGMYAEVHFQFARATPPMLIPATAMIFRTGSAQVAVVGPDSIAHFHNLRIGRDFGSAIEVDSGLADGAFVVTEPSDDLRDGERVHARPESASQAPGGGSPGGRPANPGSEGDSATQKPVSRPSTPAAQQRSPANAPAPARRIAPQLREGFPGSPAGDPPSPPARAPSPRPTP